MVVMDTTLGIIAIELWPDKAPGTVENFLQYVDEEFYNGTIFHRVIQDFMSQGGGFLVNMESRETRPPIANEARADAPNDRGAIAMARTDEIDSATSQFFINARDNDFLNHRGETPPPGDSATASLAASSRGWTWPTRSTGWPPARSRDARTCRSSP